MDARVRAWLRAHVAWRCANAAKVAVESSGVHEAEKLAAEANDRAATRIPASKRHEVDELLAAMNPRVLKRKKV
jgi:hypothetical protein